ncbi:MAG: GNAT family N-acetyltransferase [Egibacteraceae bacterium]
MLDFSLVSPEELPGLVPLAREFEAAIGNPIIQMKEEAFLSAWRKFIELNVGFLIVAKDAGVPVGAISAYIVPNDLNGSMLAQESWWFVKPEYRGRGVGRALIELFERYARSRGATRVSLGALLHLKPVSELLTTMGYAPFETIHYKWLS